MSLNPRRSSEAVQSTTPQTPLERQGSRHCPNDETLDASQRKRYQMLLELQGYKATGQRGSRPGEATRFRTSPSRCSDDKVPYAVEQGSRRPSTSQVISSHRRHRRTKMTSRKKVYIVDEKQHLTKKSKTLPYLHIQLVSVNRIYFCK